MIFAGYFFSDRGINHETIQLTQKQSQMKKFFFVAATVFAFAACNNSASTEAKADSTKTDSSAMMKTDSSKMGADSSKMAADTTKKDTATKK